MTEHEREIEMRLRELRSRGYVFLSTCDDGNTWTGSNDLGLPLELLIHTGCFRGKMILSPPVADLA
jgi:hypothetical protein